jgi:hypothetical protein
MSQYLETIAESLIDVLNRAAGSRDHRLSGYAATVDFWIGEIQHVITALDTFPQRQARFADAMQQAIAAKRDQEIERSRQLEATAAPTELYYGEGTCSIELHVHLKEVGRLRVRLLEAARKFLGRLRNEELISKEEWQCLKNRLSFL